MGAYTAEGLADREEDSGGGKSEPFISSVYKSTPTKSPSPSFPSPR